jgi:ribosomal protein S18 acetylase RimI-like enzyme
MSDLESRPFALRPARKEDDEFLFSLYASANEETLGFVDWESEAIQKLLRMQYRLQQAHYGRYSAETEVAIVVLDGEPIGRFDTQRSSAGFRLIDIALLPTHRGRGMGRRLIQDLLALARVEGKPVRLQVKRGNRAAHLYARLGFKRVSESSEAPEAEIYYEMEWLPE